MLVIKYKGVESSRMMAISVKRYQDSLNDKLQSQKIGKGIGYTIIGVVSLLGAGLLYAYFSKKTNNTNVTN